MSLRKSITTLIANRDSRSNRTTSKIKWPSNLHQIRQFQGALHRFSSNLNFKDNLSSTCKIFSQGLNLFLRRPPERFHATRLKRLWLTIITKFSPKLASMLGLCDSLSRMTKVLSTRAVAIY